MRGTVEERFLAKTSKTDTCWNWTGAKDGCGYGNMKIAGRAKGSHRLSYEMYNGPIVNNLEVDHTCHNRACVNPTHLRLVTHKQNKENSNGARSDSKSGVRGVSWDTKSRKWRASLGSNGKTIHLGMFDSIDEASKVAVQGRNERFTHNDLDRPNLST